MLYHIVYHVGQSHHWTHNKGKLWLNISWIYYMLYFFLKYMSKYRNIYWNSFSLFRVFLVRDSQSNPKTFVLSMSHGQKIKHFQIIPVSNLWFHIRVLEMILMHKLWETLVFFGSFIKYNWGDCALTRLKFGRNGFMSLN